MTTSIFPEVSTRRDPRLSVVQIHAARSLADGQQPKDVAARYGVTLGTLKQWRKLQRFQAEHDSYLGLLRERAADLWLEHEREIQDELKAAERDAIHVLRQGLNASVPLKLRPPGKDGRKGRIQYIPDYPTRVRAAISLLDRRGERGKPVERVAQANFNYDTPEIRNQLTSALADPIVRAMLEKDPVLAQRLREEIGQLLLSPEAACETPAPSPSPSSASSPAS